jgi:hypothetical protein
VRLIGGKSGFKTVRDLVLFIVGLGVCIFHIATTKASDLSLPLLFFFGGMAGVPIALKQDEKKEK